VRKMRPSGRLFWAAIMIVGSSLYGVLISLDPRTASSIMLGYIGVLLTVFIVCQVWRRP
jgi:FtsH-binding integral membrane protein